MWGFFSFSTPKTESETHAAAHEMDTEGEKAGA
jgi:hypothetical protein